LFLLVDRLLRRFGEDPALIHSPRAHRGGSVGAIAPIANGRQAHQSNQNRQEQAIRHETKHDRASSDL
jgi:hypothetical protein